MEVEVEVEVEVELVVFWLVVVRGLNENKLVDDNWELLLFWDWVELLEVLELEGPFKLNVEPVPSVLNRVIE